MIYPKYIGLQDWWNALNIDYPQELIPLLANDNDWQQQGKILAGTGVFAQANIPSPSPKEEDWSEWARSVFLVMMNWRG